jgi:O-antigen ligase
MDTMKSVRISAVLEKFLVLSLSGFAGILFFTDTDRGLIKLFSILSIIALLVWRYIIRYQTQNPLPKYVFITSILFIASVSIGVLLSEDRYFALILFKHYRFILLGGLLFTAPIRDRYREYIIVIFFSGAAVAGIIGIVQYFGFMQMPLGHPEGFSGNPNFYAGGLAIVCSSSIVLLLSPRTYLFTSKKGLYFIISVVVLTLCGVILSQSRGIWIAFFTACVITLYLYDHKKAFAFLLSCMIIIAILFSISDTLKRRAFSIVTSLYAEDEAGSTDNRIELWKDSLLMFKEHPLLGTGLGDFETEINKIISLKKLKKIHTTSHAHNIYFQVLVTRGGIGFAILLALLVSLLKWGQRLIHDNGGIGGYIIILTTLLTMVGGLTDDHIEFTLFLAAYCLIVGLLGPIGTSDEKNLSRCPV